MTAIPMICLAYAFVSVGFCLGYVACAVLSRNTAREDAPVEVIGYQPRPMTGKPTPPPGAP